MSFSLQVGVKPGLTLSPETTSFRHIRLFAIFGFQTRCRRFCVPLVAPLKFSYGPLTSSHFWRTTIYGPCHFTTRRSGKGSMIDHIHARAGVHREHGRICVGFFGGLCRESRVERGSDERGTQKCRDGVGLCLECVEALPEAGS